jgi:thiol:disulfide interchange protein DsbC
MNKSISALCLSIAATLSFGAIASAKDVPAVAAKIKEVYPTLKFKNIVYIPEVDLYEVRIVDTNMLSYTNKDVKFFLVAGEIVDPLKKKNVSRERVMVNAAKFMNELDYKKAITFKYGTGERKIVIFTDPDCPYCKSTDREIHNNLTQDNVTVSYFFNPLQIQGHEQAPLKAAKIWCAPDKQKAFKDWMLNNILPSNDGSCPNPVKETKAIAESMRFMSTPTILFDNGHIATKSLDSNTIKEVLADKPPISPNSKD